MNIDTIQFCILDMDAVMPSKFDEDAGYDIYACFPEPYRIIEPNETVVIPTGIASVFDKKYVAILKERGSTGTKGMGQRAGIIDSGYRGEWLVSITNHNTMPIAIVKDDELDQFQEDVEFIDDYIIYSYDRAICQAIFLEVPKLKIVKINEDDLDKAASMRGKGKLGSSGK